MKYKGETIKGWAVLGIGGRMVARIWKYREWDGCVNSVAVSTTKEAFEAPDTVIPVTIRITPRKGKERCRVEHNALS